MDKRQYEILKQIEEIDDQLEQNKEIIDKFAGKTIPADDPIAVLCEQTVQLIIIKFKLKKILLDEYDFFLMD